MTAKYRTHSKFESKKTPQGNVEVPADPFVASKTQTTPSRP